MSPALSETSLTSNKSFDIPKDEHCEVKAHHSLLDEKLVRSFVGGPGIDSRIEVACRFRLRCHWDVVAILRLLITNGNIEYWTFWCRRIMRGIVADTVDVPVFKHRRPTIWPMVRMIGVNRESSRQWWLFSAMSVLGVVSMEVKPMS